MYYARNSAHIDQLFKKTMMIKEGFHRLEGVICFIDIISGPKIARKVCLERIFIMVTQLIEGVNNSVERRTGFGIWDF